MWFSVAELKYFYEKMGFTPDSPCIAHEIQTRRANLNHQSPDIVYLLENIDDHLATLLNRYSSSLMVEPIINFSIFTAEQLENMIEITRYTSDELLEIHHYLKQNISLALPLCKQTIIHFDDIEMIDPISLQDSLRIPLDHKTDFGKVIEETDTSTTLEFLLSMTQQSTRRSHIRRIPLKIMQLSEENEAAFKKRHPYFNLQIDLSILLYNLLVTGQMLLLKYLIPVYFFTFLYIETNNKKWRNNAVLALTRFRKKRQSENLNQEFQALLTSIETRLLDGQALHKIIKHNKWGEELLDQLEQVLKDPSLETAIQTRLTNAFMISLPIYTLYVNFTHYFTSNNVMDTGKLIKRDILNGGKAIMFLDKWTKLLNVNSKFYYYLNALSSYLAFSAVEKKYYTTNYIQRMRMQSSELIYKVMIVDALIKVLSSSVKINIQ